MTTTNGLYFCHTPSRPLGSRPGHRALLPLSYRVDWFDSFVLGHKACIGHCRVDWFDSIHHHRQTMSGWYGIYLPSRSHPNLCTRYIRSDELFLVLIRILRNTVQCRSETLPGMVQCQSLPAALRRERPSSCNGVIILPWVWQWWTQHPKSTLNRSFGVS